VTAPTCTCHPVPEQYHTTHYGATEPGSTLEPDYDCPVHFPEPKRKWGDAPAHVFKTPAGCWHWRCKTGPMRHQTRCCQPTHTAALAALAEHQRAKHVDAPVYLTPEHLEELAQIDTPEKWAEHQRRQAATSERSGA
jgi:hypothetical protein